MYVYVLYICTIRMYIVLEYKLIVVCESSGSSGSRFSSRCNWNMTQDVFGSIRTLTFVSWGNRAGRKADMITTSCAVHLAYACELA